MRDVGVEPRDGAVEEVVDLVDSGPVVPARHSSTNGRGHVEALESKNLGWRQVEDDSIGTLQFAQVGDLVPEVQPPAVAFDDFEQRVDDPLRASACRRPASGHAEGTEQQPECGGERLAHWGDRMRGRATEQRPGSLSTEDRLREHVGRRHRLPPEPRQGDGVRRPLEHGPEQVLEVLVDVLDHVGMRLDPRLPVAPQFLCGLLQRRVQDRRRLIVERVRHRESGVAPLETVFLELQFAECGAGRRGALPHPSRRWCPGRGPGPWRRRPHRGRDFARRCPLPSQRGPRRLQQ